MSPRHLSHNDLAELAALPFEALSEHAAAHLAQCTHCADDYALACEGHALASTTLVVALDAGWRPPKALASANFPWVHGVSLAAGIVAALYTAPVWSLHLAAISLNRTAHVFAAGARLLNHMGDATPLLLFPLACLALALSRSPQGEAHV